jgi:hypothetical protein
MRCMRTVKVRRKEPANGQGILYPDNESNPIWGKGGGEPLNEETVKKLLNDQGVCVTSDQAQLVLQLLHQLSNIIVLQFLQNEQDS